MSTEALDEQARTILRDNDKGGYTVPTRGMYPFQWNWDSAFVALGFATIDLDRALTELETLFAAQWPDGMVPHIVFHAEDAGYFPGPDVWQAGAAIPSSGITQPPVAASIAWRLWNRAIDSEHKRRLASLFPKIMAWHRWFDRYRNDQGRGLVTITHPWESGRDNSPEWDAPMANVDVHDVEPYQRRDLDHADAAMRPTPAQYDCYIRLVQYGRDHGWNAGAIASDGPFRVVDVGMSMMLLRANRDLARFAAVLDESKSKSEIQTWIEQATAGMDFLWDERNGTYCSRDLITGQHSGFVTSASFLNFYAGVGTALQRDALDRHWQRIAARATYMVPSFDPDERDFDELRYWRGPVWAVMNYMIAQGFSEHGREELATRVRNDTRRMMRETGFNEAYSPLTGVGSGGTHFSWSAAIWLAWA